MDEFELVAGIARAIGFPVGARPQPEFVVRAGSTAFVRKSGADRGGKLPPKRDALQREEVLMPHPKHTELLVFTRDHRFSSATAAGDMVNGANISAPQHWRHTVSGVSLNEWLVT